MDAAEAGTACATEWPQRRGKAPCGVSGTGTRATGWVTGQKGDNTPLSDLRNSAGTLPKPAAPALRFLLDAVSLASASSAAMASTPGGHVAIVQRLIRPTGV